MRKVILIYCFFLTACYSSKEFGPLAKEISITLDRKYWAVDQVRGEKVLFKYIGEFYVVKHIATRAPGFTREMVYEKKEEKIDFTLLLSQLPTVATYDKQEKKRLSDIRKLNPKAIVSRRDSVHINGHIIVIDDSFHGPQLVSGFLTLKDRKSKEQLKVLIDQVYNSLGNPESLNKWYHQRNELIEKQSGTDPQE